MIPEIITTITVFSFSSIAKKKGASKTKWALIGLLLSITSLIFIPATIILITGRKDLDGLSLMAGVLIVMAFGPLLSKRIKTEKC